MYLSDLQILTAGLNINLKLFFQLDQQEVVPLHTLKIENRQTLLLLTASKSDTTLTLENIFLLLKNKPQINPKTKVFVRQNNINYPVFGYKFSSNQLIINGLSQNEDNEKIKRPG
ncbi:hypothetical protein [Liquorilactobacillus oeni]|uniref:Uncharacterized protein n=1 Tax=Liquorilactobacillus oeni DSM 19972 TaxID=1423777 RepID=A0A0R1ML70_9LACO|nr:hypothetical protein [Liquorilactobacillus oeni]KRL04728.1 hypothetical protein FD46_GL001864 [Liquorilactobacillus oeni DSM 19972]